MQPVDRQRLLPKIPRSVPFKTRICSRRFKSYFRISCDFLSIFLPTVLINFLNFLLCFIRKESLKSILKKLYGRKRILSNNMEFHYHECYMKFLWLRRYKDIFHLSSIQPTMTLLHNLAFYRIARGFQRSFATGVAC